VDVACHLEKTADRQTLVGQLAALAQEWPGVVFALNRGMPVDEYAAALGRAKIVIHLGTHPQCRSHRVFDALAAGACLLTSPLPDYGDGFEAGRHYLEWRNFGQLARLIEDRLGDGWQEIAEQGRALVMERHTWRTRAREFVDIVEREHLC
jgi:spore maturation protein CgeB